MILCPKCNGAVVYGETRPGKIVPDQEPYEAGAIEKIGEIFDDKITTVHRHVYYCPACKYVLLDMQK